MELLWEIFFWVILALFANFEAERVRNSSKKRETASVNVSYNLI
jgi:hypothetical protein